MSDTPTPAGSAPSAPSTPKTDVVHDVVVPVAQAAVGGIVSAAVNHVAAKTGAPKAGAPKPRATTPE